MPLRLPKIHGGVRCLDNGTTGQMEITGFDSAASPQELHKGFHTEHWDEFKDDLTGETITRSLLPAEQECLIALVAQLCNGRGAFVDATALILTSLKAAHVWPRTTGTTRVSL